MISKTKSPVSEADVKAMFLNAGIENASNITSVDTGEYNAIFTAESGGKEYVIKIAPPPSVSVMTYEQNLMATELYWYEQLRNASITIPKIHFQDLTPTKFHGGYFVMEKLPGKALNQLKLSKAEREHSTAAIASIAAEIHKVKNDRFGYIQTGLYESWYSTIKVMTENLIKDATNAGKSPSIGQKLLGYIEHYKDILTKVECRMVNFDIHPGNIIKTSATEYALVDLERGFWGDPVAEFVNLEMMTAFEKKQTSINAYNRLAETPLNITKEEKIRFAIALGYLGLLMGTERYYRYTRRNFGWWRNKLACAMLTHQAFGMLNEPL